MNKDVIFIIACVTLTIAFSYTLFAQPMSQDGQAPTPMDLSLQATRACMYTAGGWTIVDCSNAAAAQSAQLVSWARYVIQCGDDSYIAWGDDATDEADSNDAWVPLGAWTDWFTSDTVRYVSCLNKNVDSDCRIIRCQ